MASRRKGPGGRGRGRGRGRGAGKAPKPGKEGRGGLFGSGVGPDIQVGGTTLVGEVAGGLTGLGRLIAPGSKKGEPGLSDVLEGLGSSVGGTGINLADLATLGALPDARLRRGLGQVLGDTPEEERALTPESLLANIRSRGLLPALGEEVGNVALVAGVAAAPFTGGASLAAGGPKLAGILGKAAKAGGAVKTAERLGVAGAKAGEFAERLRPIQAAARKQPLLTALRKPYVSAGRAARSKVLAPRVAAPGVLGGVERALVGRVDARKELRRQTSLAEYDRRAALRAPSLRAMQKVASEHLVKRGMKRAEADKIIGDEIMSRLELPEIIRRGSEDVLKQGGIRESFIPADLRTPELESLLDDAAAQYAADKAARTIPVAAAGRKGMKGLEDIDSTEVGLSPRQQAALGKADQLLAKAEAEPLRRRIVRERGRAEAKTGALAARAQRLEARVRQAAVAEAKAATAEAAARKAADTAADAFAKAVETLPPGAGVGALRDARLVTRATKKAATAARATAALATKASRHAELAKAAARVDQALETLTQTLESGTLPGQVRRAGFAQEAGRLIEGVSKQTEVPSLALTPARYQPMVHALRELAKVARESPALAEEFGTIAEKFPDMLARAAELGFDPEHVRHFTPAQVRKVLFGSLRLGLQEVEAGSRKQRRFVTKGMDRSVTALAAALVEFSQEARTNAVIDWVESIARPVAEGAAIPQGWVLWDPVRRYLRTGEQIVDGGAQPVAVQQGLMIPKSVQTQILNFSKDYTHWAPQMLAKVTNPWRAMVLTLSPGWYVRNIAGNAFLATVSGVRLQDWVAAWSDVRARGDESVMASFRGTGLAQELGDRSQTILPGGFGPAAQERGMLGVAAEATQRLRRLNEAVDEFARSAVYMQGKRLNLSPEAAWERANRALVDYGNLSGFERSVVRSVVPFYTWQKGLLGIFAKEAIDHPARTALLLQLGQINEEYIADYFGLPIGAVPEHYRYIVGGKNVRGFIPFADAADLLTPDGIVRSMNPLLEIGARKGFGAPEAFPEQYRLGQFGRAEQDISVGRELQRVAAGLPVARLMGVPYPGAPSAGQGRGLRGRAPSTAPSDTATRVGRFLGAPPEVDVARIRERLLKAQRTLGGSGARAPVRVVSRRRR